MIDTKWNIYWLDKQLVRFSWLRTERFTPAADCLISFAIPISFSYILPQDEICDSSSDDFPVFRMRKTVLNSNE